MTFDELIYQELIYREESLAEHKSKLQIGATKS